MPTLSNDRRVRPIVAAFAFGFLASLFIVPSGVLLFEYLHDPTRRNAMGGVISFLSPAVPLIYFATRGFKAGRQCAFESLPQYQCFLATLIFIVIALILGAISHRVELSFLPILAAFMFALCVRPIRNVLAIFYWMLP